RPRGCAPRRRPRSAPPPPTARGRRSWRSRAAPVRAARPRRPGDRWPERPACWPNVLQEKDPRRVLLIPRGRAPPGKSPSSLTRLRGGEAAEKGQTGRLALFRVELGPEHRAAADGGAERRAVLAGQRHVLGPFRIRIVAVHEVEERPVGDVAGGRPAPRLVPPHVRDLRPGRSTNRRTRPGRTPRPSASGFSSLRSNSSCIPMQIPKKGRPLVRKAPIAWRRAPPPRSSAAAQAPNAPWPGTTSLSARATVSASALTAPSAPTAVSAFSTLRRLPLPRSATTTRPLTS